MTTLSVPTKGWAFMRNGFSFVHKLTAHLFEADPVYAANQEYYHGERVRIETVNSRNTVTNGVINVTREAMLQMALKIINDPAFNPDQSVTFKNPEDNQRDLVMHDTGLWVEVDNIQIYIQRTDEGVVVDLFGDDPFLDESIASTWVTFNEAKQVEEEESDE